MLIWGMRIISPFHDYYDSAMAYGSDSDAIYQRKTSLVAGAGVEGLNANILPWSIKAGKWSETGVRMLHVFNKKIDVDKLNRWTMRENPDILNLGEAFLLVAGKAYPVWLRSNTAQCGLIDPGSATQWLGSPTVEDALKQAHTQINKGSTDIDLDTSQSQSMACRRDKKAFNAYETARDKFLDQDFTQLHLNTGSPIILVSKVSLLGYLESQMREPFEKERLAGREIPPALVLNPRLADLNMANVLDPASAFQEVSQFISGVAPGQQMPMVEISDEDKVHKRGFDPKYGFRTRPKGMG